jgi:hypothetical protein
MIHKIDDYDNTENSTLDALPIAWTNQATDRRFIYIQPPTVRSTIRPTPVSDSGAINDINIKRVATLAQNGAQPSDTNFITSHKYIT